MEIFFKSLTKDGQADRVTIEDMRRIINQLKMRDEIASANDFVEKIAGVHNAKHFDLRELNNILINNAAQNLKESEREKRQNSVKKQDKNQIQLIQQRSNNQREQILS